MGTNYYLTPTDEDDTECWHVGKSSAGWAFCFHALEPIDGPSLRTAEQWRATISGMTAGSWTLRDEYGHDVDPDDFWAKVEAKRTGHSAVRCLADRACATDLCREQDRQWLQRRVDEGIAWLDPEGHEFHSWEFS